jgi:uncharacterized protein involved in outer membrane biogenesis
MKKIVVLIGVVAVLVIAAVVAGLLLLNRAVKAGVETAGPMVTKSTVTLGGANISLFSGSGSLNDFVVGNPEGFKTAEAIKVSSVAVSLAPKSVFSDKVWIKSVRVDGPEITYETALKGSNLSKLLENIQAAAGAAGSTNSSATALQVDEFVISGGKIHLGASMLGGSTATLPLPEIRLASLGQGPEGITPAELGVKAMEAILTGTLKAVGENAVALGKDAVGGALKIGGAAADTAKDAGSAAAGALKDAGSGVKDLFKKK